MRRWLAALLRRWADRLSPSAIAVSGELEVRQPADPPRTRIVRAAVPAVPVHVADMAVDSDRPRPAGWDNMSASVFNYGAGGRTADYMRGRDNRTVIEGFTPVERRK
jgi:hypothetical protein